jgi:hypothetical protein
MSCAAVVATSRIVVRTVPDTSSAISATIIAVHQQSANIIDDVVERVVTAAVMTRPTDVAEPRKFVGRSSGPRS